MNRTALRRIAAAVTLVGLAIVTFAMPQQTVAGWTETVSTNGSVNALTVPRPTISACNLQGGFNPTISLVWTPPAGYNRTNATFATQETVGGIPTLVPLAAGAVTTTVSIPYTSSYSTGLLSGLFGGSKTVGFRLTHPGTTWSGQWRTATASVTLFGIPLGCTINP